MFGEAGYIAGQILGTIAVVLGFISFQTPRKYASFLLLKRLFV